MSIPKITVLIPCYNQGKFIDDAIDSIQSQSFQDFEIIIINDGSDDLFTEQKLSDYDRPKTRVIHTSNNGLSAARNRGFSEARGEYIQFLDSDDIILPKKFEEQLVVFNEQPHIAVCYSDYKIYDIKKELFLSLPEKAFLGIDPLSDFLFRWERGLSIPIHCALFKKSLWSDNPFNTELKAKEDWLMWCELAARGISFSYLNKEYAIYRFHETNMTKNIVEMNYAFFLSTDYIMQIIPEKYRKEFLRSSILHMNNILGMNIYPDLINQINDLKTRFDKIDHTVDYKIGHFILKPYRFIRKIMGKKYLLEA